MEKIDIFLFNLEKVIQIENPAKEQAAKSVEGRVTEPVQTLSETKGKGDRRKTGA